MVESTHFLVLKAQKGEKNALNELFNLWYDKVFNIAYKYFSNEEMAQDICQQTFLTIQNKIGQLKDPERFKYWIYRTTINHCHTEVRNAKSRAIRLKNYFDINQTEWMPSHEGPYHEEQKRQLVLQVLQKIPKEQRTIIIMKEYEGLKFREIAELLDISENTAKSRLYYGLKAMRKLLESDQLTKEYLL